MAMSDCVQCWETPCRCGHDYQHWDEEKLKEQIRMLQNVLDQKVKKREELKELDRQKSIAENPHRHWPFPTPNKRPGGESPLAPKPKPEKSQDFSEAVEKKKPSRKKPLSPANSWPFPTKTRK